VPQLARHPGWLRSEHAGALRAAWLAPLQVEEPAFLPPLEQGLTQEAWRAFQEASAVQQQQQHIADEAAAAAAEAARAGARALPPR
jgi:hypothetical protein